MRKLKFSLLLTGLLLVFLLTGCTTQTVTPEDVYHYTTVPFNGKIAKNIKVEQTPQGIRITGDAVSITFLPIEDRKFRAIIEPQGVSLNYDVQDMPVENGEMYLKVVMSLGGESMLPAHLPVRMDEAQTPALYGPYPDVINSEQIHVTIHPEVGVTRLAGLDFHDEVVLNIHGDGIVEADREGIIATDKDGNEWISSKVKLNDEVKTLFIRNNLHGENSEEGAEDKTLGGWKVEYVCHIKLPK